MQSAASDRELIVRHRRREAARRPVTILPILKFLPCLLQVFQRKVSGVGTVRAHLGHHRCGVFPHVEPVGAVTGNFTQQAAVRRVADDAASGLGNSVVEGAEAIRRGSLGLPAIVGLGPGRRRL